MMSNKKEYQIKLSIIAPEHWPDFKALSDFVSKRALLSLFFFCKLHSEVSPCPSLSIDLLQPASLLTFLLSTFISPLLSCLLILSLKSHIGCLLTSHVPCYLIYFYNRFYPLNLNASSLWCYSFPSHPRVRCLLPQYLAQGCRL